MPRYYARIGQKTFHDGSVLMVREDGTREFISMLKNREVQSYDRGAALQWTQELREQQLHEVFLIDDPSLLVDEGL